MKTANYLSAIKSQNNFLAAGFKKIGFWASTDLQNKIEKLMVKMEVKNKKDLFEKLIEEKYKNTIS